MSERTIAALSAASDAETLLRAPKVGVWSTAVVEGAVVTPGAAVGTLRHLGRSLTVVAPAGASGRVALFGRGRRAEAVAYGDVLLRLTVVTDLDAAQVTPTRAAQQGAGGLVVIAPTAGVFYRSPGVNAPPFVSAGDAIRRGQPVGLIEVMKTFNPIPYDGEGLPDEAVVIEVLVADGAEVRAGQALVSVRTP
jgi:acetyl-CoA carboxylase biotin carboxyl carrier protein